MRLYHFTTERYGLEAIRDSRLKLARINELNDPFEFLGLSLPGPKNRLNREVLREWKREMSRRCGLICMSATWQEPLLWGHYADKHQGLCLGFDCHDEGFMHVNYVKERPTLLDFGIESLADLNEADMNKMLRTKFEAWGYEQEYRAFCSLDERDPVSDLYYAPFSENVRLVEIIVGERSKMTRNRLRRCLGKRANAVSSFKARSGFTKFEVIENKSKSAWQ